MTKSKTRKKKGAAAIITAVVLALIALFGMAACSNAAQPGTGTDGSTALPEAPFVEGGASLILSPDKLDIKVRVRTADGTPVTVEGCEETTLTSGTETVLHAKGTLVILKGKISKFDCGNFAHYKNPNKLTDLNVQGLTALQELYCAYNRLTALNIQGLTALQVLSCYENLLTELNVQGLTALKVLERSRNRLTELNVQGLTYLRWLDCGVNRLTELNVQGLNDLRTLGCGGNQLTDLNVQGLTVLQKLYCWGNQLTELNAQGLTDLKELSCWGNQLNADVFKKLFDGLPIRADSDEAKCSLYTEKTDVTEGNHTDFTAPPDLADAFNNAKTVKKWKMYKSNGIWPGVEI